MNTPNPTYSSEQLILTGANFGGDPSDYTVDCDVMAEQVGGIFGLIVRAQDGGNFYDLCCNNGVWQFERHEYSGGSVNFVYLGSTSTPAYTAGTWVHLRVVCCGNDFYCYLNLNDGTGDQLLFHVTDSTFPSGNPGIRSGYMASPNQNSFSNYQVTACASAVDTPVFSTQAENPIIFPSPARGDHVTLAYQMKSSGQMEMILWNQNREKAADITAAESAGEQKTSFSILGFSPGIYLYSVTLHYDSGASQKFAPGKFAIVR
ncbi:MAG: hypothetical protein ACREL1_07990 [bacterium]